MRVCASAGHGGRMLAVPRRQSGERTPGQSLSDDRSDCFSERSVSQLSASFDGGRSPSPCDLFSNLSNAFRLRRLEGLARGLRFVSGAASIFISYQLTPNKYKHHTPEMRDAEASRLNKRAADQALELILNMKGYYIKAAQTMCGAGQFPEEFDESFAVLLDQCPQEPYRVVKAIIEEQLGVPLREVFQDFEQKAIAAASIGQVHFATLKDGTKVAVKVQYPEVEEFFRMDVDTVSFALQLGGMGKKVKEVFKTMQDQFQQEFDYTREAGLMREMAENIMPHFGDKVKIPYPIDGEHQNCPGHLKSLCTRKVMTMERLEGTPIRNHILPLMELFAKTHNTTVEELKKQMNQKDPSKLDMNNEAVKAAMNMGEVSERKSKMLIFAVKVRNLTAKLLGSCAGGCCQKAPEWTKKQLPVPPNGPKLAKLLFEVHGHQIFQDGLFNSDPHAGNVLMMPDGRLGLIDYGAVMRLTVPQRINIARMLVAIADENDDAVPQAFFDCGFKTARQDSRLALLLAHVFFNRGPYPYDMNRIHRKVGMPKNADIMTLDKYIRGGRLDDIKEFPGHLVMLQRCCMVLSGMGMELGAGRLSAAGMLKSQALKFLQERNDPSVLKL